jgi:putative membrane protein
VGVLIVYGVEQIRDGNVNRHKSAMVAATALFAVFLALYLFRMVVHGPTPFAATNPTAPGWAETFYYAFLGIHMVLAIVTIALIPVVFYRASEKRWSEHRSLAVKVAPMWLVSIVMGIAVYFLLFQTW